MWRYAHICWREEEEEKRREINSIKFEGKKAMNIYCEGYSNVHLQTRNQDTIIRNNIGENENSE